MGWKIAAIVALLMLPLSVALWRKSHVNPEFGRYDVTEYKSLRLFLEEGRCGLRLLSMPSKSVLASEFRSVHVRSALGNMPSFSLTSRREGPYRITWLVFPFWFTTTVLTLLTVTPVVRGPMRRWWRHKRGLCQECGYDLRGCRAGRCSECGTRFR